MGIGDPAVRKPNSSVQSVPTYVWLYYSKFSFQKSKYRPCFLLEGQKIDEISTLDVLYLANIKSEVDTSSSIVTF